MPRAGRKSTLRKLFAALAISLGAAALSCALWLPGILDGLEGWSYNLRARALSRPAMASDEIVLIFIDQASLDWADDQMSLSWPWAREVYAPIIDFCKAGGAKSFAMDLVFTEPSRNGVEDDAILAASVKAAGNVVSAISLFSAAGGGATMPEGYASLMPAFKGEEAWLKTSGESVERYSLDFNIPEYDSACAAMGNVLFDSDPDHIFRRIQPVISYGGVPVPSLGLAAYLQGNGIREISYGNGSLEAGGKKIPLDGKGGAVLRFRGPSGSHKTFNASEILQSAIQYRDGDEPKYEPSIFKDKYVFFGCTAVGLFDLRPSPMEKNYPGVEIHATFLDNLLSGGFIREIPRPLGALAVLALCLFSSLAMVHAKRTALQALNFGGFILLPIALAFGLYALGLWFPMMPALIALILCLSASALFNYSTEGRQKAFIKSAFKQYLSPIVIEQLIANPEKLNLGGERRLLSIYFSDVQGFTSLSEALSPEELTSVLNEYLSAMTDIIQDEGGTVDKYEGDAIIAFWNAPLDFPDHGLRAVRASLRCQEKLAQMRPDLKARTGKELFMRIGLNTGPAVVGNMGSKTRFDYTMLGDAVNLAARLEGVNKQFGTYTMISQNTLAELKGEFAVRELSRIAVVGKKIPVTVYEPMRHEEYQARKETLERFAQGLALYYEGKFPEALSVFEPLADKDPPAAKYLAQCERIMASPPEKWDGVWTMTEK
jgi:adenylate cyclase